MTQFQLTLYVIDALLTKVVGENAWRTQLLRADAAHQRIAAAAASPFYNVGVSIDSVMVDPYRRG